MLIDIQLSKFTETGDDCERTLQAITLFHPCLMFYKNLLTFFYVIVDSYVRLRNINIACILSLALIGQKIPPQK